MHTLLRTGTYRPREGDDGEFKTQFYPDGSAVIVHERGITFVSRRAPYFVSVARVGQQASVEPDRGLSDQPSQRATFLRLVSHVR